MDSGWVKNLLTGIVTVNQLLTAGIAITAFSLFLYSLSFNLRDRVARSFAIILLCVVIVFTCEAISSASDSIYTISFLLRFEWFGIIFLPAAYLHFSDALLVTTGRPSKGRRRLGIRLVYAISVFFLILLVLNKLVGPIIPDAQPAAHLVRTTWTNIFTLFYCLTMIWAWINFARSFQRTMTRSGRRRMFYLLGGATAPALGSFPYLLFGSSFASTFPLIFWGTSLISNLMVGGLIILMAYAVAFFGVSWPDRVVKSRLFKWIMRGPVTASITLGFVTITRRIGENFGIVYSSAVPTVMVAVVLIMEHVITLVAPVWEKLIFYGNDRTDLVLLKQLEDRLITKSDLKQFLEAILAAIRDHLQSQSAFVAALDDNEISMIVATGQSHFLKEGNLLDALNSMNKVESIGKEIYTWRDYYIFPLYKESLIEEESPKLLGLIGVLNSMATPIHPDQKESLNMLFKRASLALQDRILQESIFQSMSDLQPQIDLIQKWRVEGRYDSNPTLLSEPYNNESDLINLVRDALTHYWGGPKLSQSPLMKLDIVKQAFNGENENPSNALRAILRKAIDGIRPEGERKFTAEWILFNILELKFVEGHKVRDVANRLAMSEADLYRKQRVAIEEVARIILDLEKQVKNQINGQII